MPSSDTLIFLDTCSLLVSCWNIYRNNTIVYNAEKDARFWHKEIPALSRAGSIILTKRNYDELVKLTNIRNDPNRPELGKRCVAVLERVHPLIKKGILSIVGDPNDPFADAVLLSVALKFRTQKNLLFLTQDRALATDLVAISNFISVRPRNKCELKVYRLNSKGSIERWHLDDSADDQRRKMQANSKPGASRTSPDNATTLNSGYTPMPEWWR